MVCVGLTLSTILVISSLCLSSFRFSNNKIVRSYCVVLSNYRNNSTALNHAVAKMLYRIAFEMKMAPLLYQISIFRIFQSILQEPDSPRIHVSLCHYFTLEPLFLKVCWFIFGLCTKIFPSQMYCPKIFYASMLNLQ